MMAEWEPRPKQLGWDAYDDNHDAYPNVDFDEPIEDELSTITAGEQRLVSQHITQSETRDT